MDSANHVSPEVLPSLSLLVESGVAEPLTRFSSSRDSGCSGKVGVIDGKGRDVSPTAAVEIDMAKRA